MALSLCHAVAHLGRERLRSHGRVGDIWVRGGEAWARSRVGGCGVGQIAIAVVFARCLRGLYAVSRLDHVGLEGNRARAAMQFEEEAAGIAEDGAGFVAAPERGRGGGTVLADGLGGGC